MTNRPCLRDFLKPSACVLALLLAAASLPGANAAEAAKRQFDLPAGSVETSLKRLSEQSGVEVLYPTNFARGARTNSVSGKLTPREALERMLAGTGLVAAEDAKTGALTVQRVADTSSAKKAVARAETAPAPRATTYPAATVDETVVLSPFEVSAAGDRGYYGANTMSGTRLNSKLEDLAASITVVTKEQMQDFAMLNINDIFNYEASTEGTGNYSDISVDGNGSIVDNIVADPNNANRIRGIGNANISLGNFETSGRVPIDPIGIDAVEISRGPNSSIFGLGNAAGTVNLQASSARLFGNQSQFGLRADSYGGNRTSLDLNRVLKKGVLAIRGSAVGQHDGFVLKPSGADTTRYNAMVKYQPFKSTSLSASYSYYHIGGNRPNATPPRDAISFWQSQGAPTWDPITNQIKRNGVVIATFPTNSGLPTYYQTTALDRPSQWVDQGGLRYWTVNTKGSTADPNSRSSNVRFLATNPEPIRTGQPLFSTTPSVASKSVYDWSSINLQAPNSFDDKTETTTVQLEHIFLDTGRHALAAQAGWYREDSERLLRAIVGRPGTGGVTGLLQIDINEKLLDGTPNPYFLRPYIGVQEARSLISTPHLRDNYRVQLAYQLDLTREPHFLRWFGRHRAVLYDEYKRTETHNYQYRDVIVGPHAWLAPGLIRGGNSGSNPLAARTNVRYYVGDANGANVDYAPHGYERGIYPFTWFNGVTNTWVNEPVQLGLAGTPTSGSGSLDILKTQGGTLQSFWLNDRVVTTFGLRRDSTYNRAGNVAAFLPDGMTFDDSIMDHWVAGDWRSRAGKTRTAGIVVKPLSWLSLHANKSDSFRPSTPAQTIYREPVPDPRGKGEDYGFTLNLIDGKLNLRANHYTTKQINSRNGNSAAIVARLLHIEFWSGSAGETFALEYQAQRWLQEAAAARGQTLSSQQLREQTAKAMNLGLDFFDSYSGNVSLPYPLTETEEVVAKGNEIELNYNPTASWTMKLNVVESQTFNSRLSPNIQKWIDERLPFWQSVIDPGTARPWFTTGYSGIQSASAYYIASVQTPLKLAVATEGKSRPQIRRYRVNYSTSYRLASITDQKHLKRVSLIGAVRWEDKGAIGYYGLQQYPAQITEYDPNRPIYDRAHFYVDVGAAYRMRLFADKVGATFQLNVRNIQENGRLQPIGAFPNGEAHTYRIVDPRQCILTASFDL